MIISFFIIVVLPNVRARREPRSGDTAEPWFDSFCAHGRPRSGPIIPESAPSFNPSLRAFAPLREACPFTLHQIISLSSNVKSDRRK
jgi:hypothetical protein